MATAQNVLVLRSPQLSFYVRTVTFVRAWICRRYAASRLQAKGRRCYLSQNIGLAVSGSAGPAPPPLNLLSNCSFEVICECWPVDLMTSINFHLCACVCVCVCVLLTMWSSVGGVLERLQLFILAKGLKTKFSVHNIK